jgi:large subunit ribosomal protein L24
VLRVLNKSNRVVVEGVRRVTKHVRKSQKHPQGGRIQVEAPIHISNVLPVDPSTGRGSRIKFAVKDGKKHRIAVGSGTDLGPVGGAK